MAAKPQKKGDTFTAFDMTLTVKYFTGKNLKQYNNYADCKRENPVGNISVINTQYGGSTDYDRI